MSSVSKRACRFFFIAQEILVDHASYPTDRIAKNSHDVPSARLRLFESRQPDHVERRAYDSDAAYGLCGAITALMHGAANDTSAEMAAVVGPFEGYSINREPFLRVMQMHREAVEKINHACPSYLRDAARKIWDSVLVDGPQVRFPQRPGHGARSDRHDQLPHGLRYHRHRA